MNNVITVGLDGTPESLSAAHWAAREALLRHARLRLLHAWTLRAHGAPQPGDDDDQSHWPRRIVHEARAAIQARRPELPMEDELVVKDPLDALLDAADRSDLLVLGSRDANPMARYVLGEVGLQTMSRSGVPTVFVRAPQDPESTAQRGCVVVGASLHEPCKALLAFAFDTAARWDVPLRAVLGRHLPAYAYNRGGGVEPYAVETAARDAQWELTEALRPWRDAFPDVPVEHCVMMESPAPALLHCSDDAGLLVVGRRHKHRALRPPIGHVVHAAAHHAPCPVAVVPHE
ncbi:universal stress protein [Streptomyces sp. NPDC050161]|uniref:universal stress protein n=1 Tax=Streptomyces sp. NPDC050161 TaxID=3365604 RepID=UPI0037B3E980